jgi:uncharacterized protein (DUF488 family)
MMARQIFTFGYEGLALDAFLTRLKQAGIETVIDVRANPLSRKRGFSKRGLAAALQEVGIAYTHARTMGCPKTVRDRYKHDGDWSSYTRSYLAYLKTQSEGLSELVQAAKVSTSCLICFEADYTTCHRTFVARAAAPLGGFRVTHLTDQTMIPDAAARSAA